MTVYVLTHCYHYETTVIMGVFASLGMAQDIMAKEAFKGRENTKPINHTRLGIDFPSETYEIEPWDVNETSPDIARYGLEEG